MNLSELDITQEEKDKIKMICILFNVQSCTVKDIPQTKPALK